MIHVHFSFYNANPTLLARYMCSSLGATSYSRSPESPLSREPNSLDPIKPGISSICTSSSAEAGGIRCSWLGGASGTTPFFQASSNVSRGLGSRAFSSSRCIPTAVTPARDPEPPIVAVSLSSLSISPLIAISGSFGSGNESPSSALYVVRTPGLVGCLGLLRRLR